MAVTFRIFNLRALHREIQAINREPANFKDPVGMEAIIDKYAPILRKINHA